VFQWKSAACCPGSGKKNGRFRPALGGVGHDLMSVCLFFVELQEGL